MEEEVKPELSESGRVDWHWSNVQKQKGSAKNERNTEARNSNMQTFDSRVCSGRRAASGNESQEAHRVRSGRGFLPWTVRLSTVERKRNQSGCWEVSFEATA